MSVARRQSSEAQELFASTMAEQVVMTLDEHDRLIAYVLGLSHALNIAFFTALAGSGEAAPRLAQLSSTTYDAQVDVATKVAGESPELYFEIQHLNEYGRESLQALRGAVELMWQSVTTGDARQFAEMMQRGREYLAGRARAGGRLMSARDLEGEVRELRARIATLVDEAANNERLLKRSQERELELLKAENLAQTVRRDLQRPQGLVRARSRSRCCCWTRSTRFVIC